MSNVVSHTGTVAWETAGNWTATSPGIAPPGGTTIAAADQHSEVEIVNGSTVNLDSNRYFLWPGSGVVPSVTVDSGATLNIGTANSANGSLCIFQGQLTIAIGGLVQVLPNFANLTYYGTVYLGEGTVVRNLHLMQTSNTGGNFAEFNGLPISDVRDHNFNLPSDVVLEYDKWDFAELSEEPELFQRLLFLHILSDRDHQGPSERDSATAVLHFGRTDFVELCL